MQILNSELLKWVINYAKYTGLIRLISGDNSFKMFKITDKVYVSNLPTIDNEEKLKEIKGTRESSAKAQQYLDGLLKIPFGIYRKEPVLSFLSDFSLSINANIKESIEKLNEYKNDVKELLWNF